MTPLREAFVEAIQAAEYDVALEQAGYEIYHFFDSDVLHRVILGYRDSQNRGLLFSSPDPPDIKTEAGRKLILAALVGHNIGIPSRIRALPPHLHEVQNLAESARRHSDWGYHDTVAQLNLQPLLRELNQLIGEQQIGALLQHFLEDGPTIFYGVDLLRGTLDSRLRTLAQLGIHKESPFDTTADIVGTPVFAELSKFVVGSSSSTNRQTSTVAGLRDAMALAMLARDVDEKREKKLEDRRGGKGVPLARFYTETPRILNSWRTSQNFRARLTYSDLIPRTGTATVRGVIRNDCYYLVRALIAPFGYGQHLVEGDEELLRSSARRLRHAGELAAAGEMPSESALATRDQGSLEFYMKQLTQLSGYNTAWRQLIDRLEERLPKELEQEFRAVITGQRTYEQPLKDEHRRLMVELNVATDSVRQFSDLFEELVHVMESSKVEQLRPRGDLSYLEHSGLSRWGFDDKDLPDKILKQMVDAFEEWSDYSPLRDVGGQHTPKAPFAVDMTLRVLALRDGPLVTRAELADHLGLIGFLCMVRAFNIVEYWGDLFLFSIRNRLGDIGATDSMVSDLSADDLARVGAAVLNKVMSTRVRARLQRANAADHMTPVEVSQLVTAVKSDVELLERRVREYRFDYSREAIALTQAYMLFHTWLTINGSLFEKPRPLRKHAREGDLAQRSFDICSAALDTAGRGHPLYPFLLNYCVYVGAAMIDLTGTDILEQSKLPDGLINVTRLDGRSYRFFDTLGYLDYVRAARAFETYKHDRSNRNQLDLAFHLSTSALDWFAHIMNSLRDLDINAHRSWLGQLRVQIDGELAREST